ncbi:hypothetical protein Scep_009775 [Stephania cephalantha]|uniref:Uncharacterized protein n=1 Tax=Stephania cephalantha TaxID=152367 RepID=A0AAP0PEM6_9MAGN
MRLRNQRGGAVQTTVRQGEHQRSAGRTTRSRGRIRPVGVDARKRQRSQAREREIVKRIGKGKKARVLERTSSRPLGEPYSYGGTKSPYMLKGLLGSRSNTVEPSHPFLQRPLGESWMHEGTKSPRHFEEPWTHGGIKDSDDDDDSTAYIGWNLDIFARRFTSSSERARSTEGVKLGVSRDNYPLLEIRNHQKQLEDVGRKGDMKKEIKDYWYKIHPFECMLIA